MTTNCYSAVRRRPASTAPCALSSTRSRSVSFFSRSRRSHRKRSISLFELSRLDDFTPFSLRRFFSRRRSRSSFASASRARFDARPLVSRRSASSSSRSARTRDGNVDRGFTSSSSPIARAYHGALAFLRPPKRVPLCSASRSRASRFASLPPPLRRHLFSSEQIHVFAAHRRRAPRYRAFLRVANAERLPTRRASVVFSLAKFLFSDLSRQRLVPFDARALFRPVHVPALVR